MPGRIPDMRHPALIPRPLKLLLAALVGVFVVAALVFPTERDRRSAEAEPELLSIDSQAAPHPTLPDGYDVHYRFVADGVSWDGVEFRSWSLTAVREAKVCYEPDNPANHSLERRGTTCG